MMYILPKARMHPVERWAAIAGLTLAGLGAGVAGSLLPVAQLLPTALSLAVTAALVLNPTDRVEYRLEPEGLRIGGRLVPFAALGGARVVKLRGTVLYGGICLPGCWWGRAWAPSLGRFTMRASTGMGRGVLLTLHSGERLVITPDRPENAVVTLLTLMRQAPRRQPLSLVHM
ncbi:MAG TPA: hypothetical protein VK464_10830 [Symbiobacteriaceae bacterium]|jgi:hypothetical protein|nr:hypothetical protein [Symbiobacteriaceae bacterium]